MDVVMRRCLSNVDDTYISIPDRRSSLWWFVCDHVDNWIPFLSYAKLSIKTVVRYTGG